MLDKNVIDCWHNHDAAGMPHGGGASVELPVGEHKDDLVVSVRWQQGPMPTPKHRNGAFVEDLLYIAQQRLRYFQETKFACEENAEALQYLGLAMVTLADRTKRRATKGTLGTHEV